MFENADKDSGVLLPFIALGNSVCGEEMEILKLLVVNDDTGEGSAPYRSTTKSNGSLFHHRFSTIYKNTRRIILLFMHRVEFWTGGKSFEPSWGKSCGRRSTPRHIWEGGVKRLLGNAFLELVYKGSGTKRLQVIDNHLPPFTLPTSPHPALASSRVANYLPYFTLATTRERRNSCMTFSDAEDPLPLPSAFIAARRG